MAIPLIIPALAVGGQLINGIMAQNKANQAKLCVYAYYIEYDGLKNYLLSGIKFQ